MTYFEPSDELIAGRRPDVMMNDPVLRSEQDCMALRLHGARR
jgi:hypothetical protein